MFSNTFIAYKCITKDNQHLTGKIASFLQVKKEHFLLEGLFTYKKSYIIILHKQYIYKLRSRALNAKIRGVDIRLRMEKKAPNLPNSPTLIPSSERNSKFNFSVWFTDVK